MASVGRRRQRGGDVSRRDFLRVGGLGVVGWSLAEQTALARTTVAQRRSCIFILMTGGASQFETFDPKPDAPTQIRGPLRAISTSVPGLALSESLPLLARRAELFSLVRSLNHDAAPIHETGQQLLQTGRLARGELRFPSFGSVAAQTLGARRGTAPYVVLPRLVEETGVNAYRGQQAGLLGSEFEPAVLNGEAEQIVAQEPEAVRRAYGDSRFGRLLLQARHLVETGTRCVTVNLFESLQNQCTWDCHGSRNSGPATVYDYRDQLCPQFDRALSALLDDLHERGLLEETLVVATGEFGRTPRVNEFGGRDHWPGVWSALVAGGGVRGGRVVGASDAIGSAPVERPVAPGELTATIFHSLGIDGSRPLTERAGRLLPVCEHAPLHELFA